MKMLKIIPVFILLFTGYLCNAQTDTTEVFSSAMGFPTTTQDWLANETHESDYFAEGTWPTLVAERSLPTLVAERSLPTLVAERSLPALVVAGVSIALVLLCILIVAIFWYAWKKSQEGSMVLNPTPYGAEAAVPLQNLPVPESQQGWPSERAVP